MGYPALVHRFGVWRREEPKVREIADRLYSNWVARSMCEKGLLEFDFEKQVYRITPLGEKLRDACVAPDSARDKFQSNRLDSVCQIFISFFDGKVTTMHCELLDFVNGEQLLAFGLDLHCEDTDSEEAARIVEWYLANTQPELFEDDGEDAFFEAFSKLIVTAHLSNMIDDGFLTYDFEDKRYYPTRLGLKLAEHMDAQEDSE